MVACLTDNFNRANNTSSLGVATTGQTWTLQSTAPNNDVGGAITAVASILGILSNQAYSSDNRVTQPAGNPGYVNIGTLDCGFANFDSSIDIPLGFAKGGGGGLSFRWSSATNYWIAFLYRSLVGSGYFLFVIKQTGAGASFTNVVINNFTSDGATGTRTLRVKGCGGHIQAWVNGTLLGDFTDTFNAAGSKHGIVSYFSTTDRLDNLSICPAACPGWNAGLGVQPRATGWTVT